MKEFLWKVSGNKKRCNLMKIFSIFCLLGSIACVFFNLFVVGVAFYFLFFILYNFSTFLLSINLFSKVIYKKCSIKLVYFLNRKNFTTLVTTILLGITIAIYHLFGFLYFVVMLVVTLILGAIFYFIIAKKIEKKNLNKITIK